MLESATSIRMTRRGMLHAILAGSTLLALCPQTLPAALRQQHQKNGEAMRKAFAPVAAAARKATVAVIADGKQVGLGAIVETDGYILTKASLLKSDLRCRLFDGRTLTAKIVGVSIPDDLALLKVDADGLPAVQWREGSEPQVGDWLATAGPDALPVAVGVVSVKSRHLEHAASSLGVVLSRKRKDAAIVYVWPGSGGDKAGLKPGDVILRIGSSRVSGRDGILKALRSHRPGHVVDVQISRSGSRMTMAVTLGRSKFRFSNYMGNRWGGKLSRRRMGFPVALQHDTLLKPDQCGGPVVDIRGRVVGINISRSGRAEAYAIPAERIRQLLPDLKSGKLSPPKGGLVLPPRQPLWGTL